MPASTHAPLQKTIHMYTRTTLHHELSAVVGAKLYSVYTTVKLKPKNPILLATNMTYRNTLTEIFARKKQCN